MVSHLDYAKNVFDYWRNAEPILGTGVKDVNNCVYPNSILIFASPLNRTGHMPASPSLTMEVVHPFAELHWLKFHCLVHMIKRVLSLSRLVRTSCLAFSWSTVRSKWAFHKRMEFVAYLWSYWDLAHCYSIKGTFLSFNFSSIFSTKQASLTHSWQDRSCSWFHELE